MSHPGRAAASVWCRARRRRGGPADARPQREEHGMSQITIIGGGLAGLTAAVACAEAGAEVVVHEAHATLGGRARTTDAPWVAHEGPHAFYADGPHWHWLVERDLVGPLAPLPLREVRGAWFHHGGRLRRTPPASAAADARPPAPPGSGGRRLPHVGRRAARRGGCAGGRGPVGRGHVRRRSRPAVGRLRLGPAAPRSPRPARRPCGGPSAAGRPWSSGWRRVPGSWASGSRRRRASTSCPSHR